MIGDCGYPQVAQGARKEYAIGRGVLSVLSEYKFKVSNIAYLIHCDGNTDKYDCRGYYDARNELEREVKKSGPGSV